MAVLHFTSGQTLTVVESVEQVREALFEPNFISDYVALTRLEMPDGESRRELLVQPSAVAYVLAD